LKFAGSNRRWPDTEDLNDQPMIPNFVLRSAGRLPGRSGLDFQRDLAAANAELPIVFITGHGDIPMTVQALKGGAIEFLTKPFRDQDLLDAVTLGLARDRVRREQNDALGALRARFEALTPRERTIMIEVAQGRRKISAPQGSSESWLVRFRTKARHIVQGYLWPSIPPI
jgi:FixJ family two-component response regulator